MRRALTAAWLFATAIAHAQPAPSVQLIAPEQCGIDREAVRRQLEVELRADGVDRVELDAEPTVARIELDCTEASRVRIAVEDLATDKHVEREVDLASVDGSVRARAIAIAAAELLRASLMELAIAEPAAPVAPVVRERARTQLANALAPPPAAPVPPPTPPRWRSPSIGMAGVARWFPASGLAIFGGRVAVDVSLLNDFMYVRGDFGVQFGTAADRLGFIDVFAFPFAVGAGIRVQPGGIRLELGGRIEGGPAQVQGRPSLPGVHARGDWQGLLLAAAVGGLGVRASDEVWLSLSIDVGWVLVGFDALSDDRTATSVGGPTGSLQIALFFAP